VDRANAAYDEALLHITPAQALTLDGLRRTGARVWSKLRQDRQTLHVVMFADAAKWDGAKGRMGRKLYAVYPDGTHHETFERSISVRKTF
jgi:hypothetical protein